MFNRSPFPALLCESKRHSSVLLVWVCAIWVGSTSGCRLAAQGKNVEGTKHYTQGNYPAAVYSFQQALANDPQNADAYYNLAATYHQIGKQRADNTAIQQAEVLYNQCLDLAPDHVDCHRGLAVLLVESQRSDRAFALMRKWAVESPQLADARVELARLYEEFGDKDSSTRHLGEALAIDNRNQRALNALALSRENAGDTVQALENYRRSLATNGSQPQIAQRVAMLERKLGVYSPAPVPGVVQPGYTPPYGAPKPPPLSAGGTRMANVPAFPLR